MKRLTKAAILKALKAWWDSKPRRDSFDGELWAAVTGKGKK